MVYFFGNSKFFQGNHSVYLDKSGGLHDANCDRCLYCKKTIPQQFISTATLSPSADFLYRRYVLDDILRVHQESSRDLVFSRYYTLRLTGLSVGFKEMTWKSNFKYLCGSIYLNEETNTLSCY